MSDALKQPVVRFSPSSGPGAPDVWGIYEPDTGSVQYICADPDTRKAALIDVVWNFDPKSFSTSYRSADQVLELVEQNGLAVEWVLDTHPHADHLMASAYLKQRTGAPAAIGNRVHDVPGLWSEIYNLPDAFDPDRDFDRLFSGERPFRSAISRSQFSFRPGIPLDLSPTLWVTLHSSMTP